MSDQRPGVSRSNASGIGGSAGTGHVPSKLGPIMPVGCVAKSSEAGESKRERKCSPMRSDPGLSQLRCSDQMCHSFHHAPFRVAAAFGFWQTVWNGRRTARHTERSVRPNERVFRASPRVRWQLNATASCSDDPCLRRFSAFCADSRAHVTDHSGISGCRTCRREIQSGCFWRCARRRCVAGDELGRRKPELIVWLGFGTDDRNLGDYFESRCSHLSGSREV